jgi:Fe-S-cluster-containing dehydrogenase component/anaerobic selenocysteine-containing dehydrogenase
MKKYWKSIEETKPDFIPESTEKFEQEDKGAILGLLEDSNNESKSSRREFLKLCGYSFTVAAVAASCERPIEKAIPYLIKPEEVTPGKASYYASTFYDGDDFSGIVVKVRDGRPIKIEGNKLCPIGKSGTTARVQASILSLYDQANYPGPMLNGEKISWETIDSEIPAKLKAIIDKNGKIVLLTSSVISPSLKAIINDFLKTYPGSSWVQYDSISYSGISEANQKTFGKAVVPFYRFDNAELILSFGSDFLGTWLMPAEFSRQFATTRTLTAGRKRMSRLIQFESGLTITGSTADERIQMKPSEEGAILLNIYKGVAEKFGFEGISAPEITVNLSGYISELISARGKALVISGSNDPAIQTVVNGINFMLDSYSEIIDLDQPVLFKQGDDRQFASLLEEMNSGEIEALFVYNTNPVFNHPKGVDVATAIQKVPLMVAMSNAPDETTALAHYVCPDNHYLASWGDAEPLKGLLTLSQPVIRPLGDTRQFGQNLLKWSGKDIQPLDYLKEYWEKNYYGQQKELFFNDFWNTTLQKGVLDLRKSGKSAVSLNVGALSAASDFIRDHKTGDGFEMLAYESIALGSGKYANNPWLQELPDPVAKISWDNYVSIAPVDAASLGIETGDMLSLNNSLQLPANVQPGQAEGTVSVAMGYGRKAGGKVAETVGGNILPLSNLYESIRVYHGFVNIEKTGEKYTLALSQTHHSMEGRDLVRETNLDKYLEDPASGNEAHKEIQKHLVTLYDKVKFDGMHWGMAIDMNKCTGCSSCVIGCQVENNIPVIGKKEVVNRRIMHWIRIDRYFSGDSSNPKVHFQPVMCQHCDNAPCENVCPVSATNHSNEGINQMAYIRCIGTKYCINNCPYKVRRFNWYAYVNNQEYDYHMNNDLGKMVLNPDVTVRERGVVEKCSFCIQRIQESKMKAKLENRQLTDGEVLPACAQACPSGAIVFGDLNDENSQVAKLYKDPRNYFLLAELHTLPSVGYLTRVRNKNV